MEIDKKVENMFRNMGDLNLLKSFNCQPLLDISEPLMFLLNELDNYYLAYTLQNRTALLKNNTKADVVEMLIVGTSIPKIKLLLEGQIDIRVALSNENKYRLGKVGNRLFPKKYVSGIEQVESKVPKIGVRFDASLPNKINLKKVLSLLEADAKFYAPYILSEENSKVKKSIHYNTNKSVEYIEIIERVDFYNNEKKWIIE